MHITPGPPSMSIAKVRELAREMAQAPTPVVCSFTRDQMVDLLTEIDLRGKSTPAPVAPVPPVAPALTSPVQDYAAHRKSCTQCSGETGRCDTGQQLYLAGCAWVMDETRMLL
jgi:hypothetical protein